MEDPIVELEKRVQHLATEVEKLRRTCVYGFGGLAIVLLVGLCIPGIGAVAILVALAILVIVIVAAMAGTGLGWLVSSVRGSGERSWHRRQRL
jgi:hypothetical protein